MNSDVLLEAVYELCSALEDLGVPCLIGGSLASITWGEPRFTQDIDVVAHIEVGQASSLVARLGAGWYIDADDVRDAVHAKRSFNAIRLRGMVKIDVFVPSREGHHAAKWLRARRVRLDPSSARELLVTSPEDILLQKLVWYRSGGEASEQQWRDVTSLLRVQAGRLDEGYLELWAIELGVADLLARARG